MGSGPSKAKKLTVPNSQTSDQHEPVVANVNKPNSSRPDTTTTAKKDVTSSVASDTLVYNTHSDNERSRTFKQNVNNNNKQEVDSRNNRSIDDSSSGLVFEDVSDLDVDIDEVLKIPVAVDYLKQKEDKEKKKRERKKAEDNSGKMPEYKTNNTMSKESTVTDTPLPETYVQRLQRQQYKFQHSLLLHDKDIIRKPREWQQDVDDNANDQEMHQVTFDATKFRAANKGGDPRKDLFSTEPEDLRTPHFLPEPQQRNFDDFEWTTKENTPVIQQLPTYNQSELDLMKELEDDVL